MELDSNVKDSIFYVCVTLVILTWSVTGHVEDMKKLQQEKEIFSEAFKNGYIQCLEIINPNVEFSKIVWKKECNGDKK